LSLAASDPATVSQAAPVIAMPPAVIDEPAPKKTELSSLGSLDVERQNAIVKVGKPYKIAGLWYVPKHQPDYDETGIASWYGPKFHGKSTANGEIYNQNRLTAAHPTLPMPSLVEVTNLANGRTILVRVNDRGPYKRGRILDLSARAAQLLGYQANGTAQVRVRYAGKASLNGDDRHEQAFLTQQAWYSGGGDAKPMVAEADFTAAIDLGDPEPDLPIPAVKPAPILKAPVIATLQSPRLKRVANSK
jgi:rare lipoprotein A